MFNLTIMLELKEVDYLEIKKGQVVDMFIN